MIRYKIKMKNKASGKDCVDVVCADNQEMLKSSVEEMGFTVLGILEESPINLNPTPAPNLAGLEDLGIGIDERAVQQQQLQPTPQPQMQPQMQPVSQVQQAPVAEVEFVDNGVAYRIINGEPYKKDWVEHDPTEYKFVRKESKKEIKNSDVLIYKLDWVPVTEDKR